MDFISEISKDEYEKYVVNHPKGHFMQSYSWGEVMKNKNYMPHYVGLKKNNKLIATSLLLEKKINKKISYFYCPRGYVMDYSDFNLLETYTNYLKDYVKKHKGIFLKIDPDIKRHNLNIEGVVDENNNNYDLMNKLKDLGYKHKGFNTSFVNEQPRFTFRLQLNDSIENIYSNMHATTRKILNKDNQYNINLYIGSLDDINDFYTTMKDTALRENIACSSLKYYKNFYNILNKENMSDLYIAKVNIKNLVKIYEDKISAINSEIEELEKSTNLNKKKTENKIIELNNEINKIIKDYEIVKDINENEVVLSSIITVKYGNKVWTVHGGNTTKLRHLNSNYLLYYTIIKDAKNNGFEIIDFFGTSGIANPKPEDPIYGIHNFKKRLGGEYTEFIGEYDLVVSNMLYTLYNLIIPVRRKLVKYLMKKKGK